MDLNALCLMANYHLAKTTYSRSKFFKEWKGENPKMRRTGLVETLGIRRNSGAGDGFRYLLLLSFFSSFCALVFDGILREFLLWCGWGLSSPIWCVPWFRNGLAWLTQSFRDKLWVTFCILSFGYGLVRDFSRITVQRLGLLWNIALMCALGFLEGKSCCASVNLSLFLKNSQS